MSSPSNQTPQAQLATFADLLRIPEEQRFHEILDGEILKKAMPGGEHSLVHGSVRGALSRFQGKPGGADRPGGWWLLIEPTIELARHEVVQPDLAGWLRTRMPDR